MNHAIFLAKQGKRVPTVAQQPSGTFSEQLSPDLAIAPSTPMLTAIVPWRAFSPRPVSNIFERLRGQLQMMR